MSKTYYSQYNQDEYIDKVILNRKRNGYFVDIGAHDGISFSNSYFFEKNRNFNGICIEPNPSVFTKLVQNRKCEVLNCCVGDVEGTVKFLSIEGSGEMLSGIIGSFDSRHHTRIEEELEKAGGSRREIDVQCIRLQNITSLQGRVIDFMSIDTEGNEIPILNSINFSRLNIKCIAIENNYDNTEIKNILKENGFVKVARHGDEIYIHSSLKTFTLEIRKFIYRLKKKFFQ